MRSYLTEPDGEYREFVSAHPAARLEPPTLYAFVATIAREWIIVVAPSGETVLAACVQHDRGNPAGSCEVVLLGCSDLDRLRSWASCCTAYGRNTIVAIPLIVPT